MEIVTQSELEAALETLASDQDVNVGVGDVDHRGWFRAKVISHDAAAGRLLVTCFMDRPGDRTPEPGDTSIPSHTPGALPQTWHAGGSFRTMSPADHERLTRFVFAEARSSTRA